MWFFLSWLIMALPAVAQDKKITAEEYIATYKDLAISEMKRTGIPASITLAQGLLESGIGNSALAKQSNNHFGIKCKKDWTGRTVNYDDDAPQECFRAYDKPEDSYIDHSDFLVNGKRYASLFELEPTDYKGWAYGLKQAGYATNPKYPELLISSIEKHLLYQYDVGNKRVVPQNDDVPVFAENTKTESSIKEYNGIPAYVVKPGDTYQSIANDRKMMRWEISKYNDLDSKDKLEPGTIIYLKPKRRKGKQEFHIVQEGESMYYISQLHGIKLKHLYKKNRMESEQQALAGEKLYLRKKRDAAPKLREDKMYAGQKRGIIADGQTNTVAETKTEIIKEKQPEKKQENAPLADNKKQPKQQPEEKIAAPKNQEASAKQEITYKEEPKNTYLPPVEEFNPNAEFHTVKDGETVEKIAYKYKVSAQEIQTWNEMTDLNLYSGQLLRVKAIKTAVKQPKQMPDGNVKEEKLTIDVSAQDDRAEEKQEENLVVNGYYTVRPGETVFSISRKLNVPVNKIHEWNKLEDNTVKPGNRLRIKSADEADYNVAETKEPEVKTETGTLYHEVQAGETLYSISRKYGVTVDALKTLNGLSGNAISLGQKLKVK